MDFDIVDNVLEDDELDALDIIIHGIPRRVHIRGNLFGDYDGIRFQQRFRLTKNSVLELLQQIEDQLEYPHDLNNSVSPINQLLLCLRFYATDGHLLSLADFGGMDKSTVSRIIVRVSEAIASLAPRYIKMPRTPGDIRAAQGNFFDVASFPKVLGAIDCTHVKIQSPGGEDAEVYRNRKSYFSLNVQAVVDANREIIDLVARWPGSVHDATIFNNSNLRAEFETGSFPNSILLGDSGYPSKTYLFTPHLNPVTGAEQLYNESHIRTRTTVEHVFGIWKRRFPILAYGSRLKVETTMTVIVATAVLHNIARRMGEELPPPPDVDAHLLEQLIAVGQIPHLPDHQNQAGNAGLIARNILIEQYFGTVHARGVGHL